MAQGDAQKAASAWLAKQGLIEELDEDQLREVQELIGLPSFGIFWAMIQWQRMRALVMLSNASLGTPERDSAAGVLQGQIRAIDDLRTLLLHIAEPTVDAAQPENEGANNDGYSA